jgi:hypothetical protein
MLTDSLNFSRTIDGNIFENINASNDEGHMGEGGSAVGSYTRTLRNSISLLGGSGVKTSATGQLCAVNGATCPLSVIEHNSWFGAGHWAYAGFVDHAPGLFPGNQEYSFVRSNSSYAATGSTNFMLGDSLGNPSVAPASNFNVAGITNNNIYGGSTAATFHAGVDSNCTPSTSLGSHYDICTASGTPGLNDKAVDPKSVDNTRNAFQWAHRVKGQAATSTGLLQAMMNCQDAWYCYEQLWNWVRQGVQPTNLALKGAAHDGKVVGASGTFGSGYSGSCGVTFTAQDSGDLGAGATAACSFIGGVPVITITSGGNYYRVATPATVGITCGGCTPAVSASLTAVVAPSDIGPVQMVAFGRVE